MADTDKAIVLNERNKILKKVKFYINENLDPRKSSFVGNTKTINEILTELSLTEQEYHSALAISSDQDYEIHYKRPPNSCFVNNYFPEGLLAWKANIDIQPVFNHYKAVSYMCSYFSKTETESSAAMKKVAKESENLNLQERMRKLALAFLSHRQCSL